MADELDPVRQNIEINVTDKGAEQTTKDLTNLNTTITATTEATKKQTTESKKQEEGFKSLKTQLKEAIVQQQKLAAQFGATSEQAIEAAKAVAEVKDEIGLQKDLVDSFNPDDKFRGLTQTAGLAALALGGVKDGFASIGIESDILDGLIGTAQSILGVTSAVGGITDAYEVLTAAKKAKTAAEVVEIGTTEALAVVEGQATVATWSFNAALLANPIVAITAGIIAAGAAIYAYTRIVSDSVKEEELAKVASMQLNYAIDQQAKSFENNNKFAATQNSHKIALLKASGASEAQINRETRALAEQEIQLAKNFRAQATLAEQKAYEANRDNPTEFNAKTLANAKENLEKAKQAVSVGYDGLIAIQNEHEVAMAQVRTDAREKEAQEAEKARDKAKTEAEKLAKEKEDARKKADEDDIKAFEKRVEQGIKDTEFKNQQDAENLKRQEDLISASVGLEEMAAEKIAEIEQGKLEQKKAIQEAEFNIASKGIQLIASIFGKSKAVQKGAIIAENAVGIGKMIVSNNVANAGALATPQAIATSGASAVPVIALNNISTGIGIAASIAATAKALSAVGGGGASGAGGAQSQPTRNVAQVGFQGSSENQISSAIAQQQKEQPPIEAFVVSQAVTDRQEADRKKELQNSF
jgi:hypothetical protein